MKTSIQKSLWTVSLCITCAFVLILSIGLIASYLVPNYSLKLLLLFFQGWLIWTFLEYFIHRFLMHELIVPGSKDTLFNHHNHHKDPGSMKVNHWDRLISLLLVLLTFALALIKNELWMTISGFIFGFAFYSYLHLLLHLPIGKILLPRIQRAHILHHSIRPNKGYSFSTILWDWMFGTLPSKNDRLTESMMKKYFSDFDHRGHLSSWTLPIPPIAIGLILLTASCAPVFSDLQSARTLGKGELEATPYYTTTGNDSEFDGDTHLRLLIRQNLSNNAFRIEYGRIFDADGGIGQLSLGYSINLKPINR
ncbi:sterol desaturase family protein [Algoriphagus hitonicola]|uniref:Fatty acid hydroxylase superfamily protein n=1 Tax=Algoriphagus hitonicola TaxID=435880 RepID=A0A1I2RTU8_9BACT|nr:sterol desaturase family protein [Algoriphagus hitonicola]SFG41201.1 Fatty acid hydroxylase superfamily protein [Algoriphagus hitonicola]